MTKRITTAEAERRGFVLASDVPRGAVGFRRVAMPRPPATRPSVSEASSDIRDMSVDTAVFERCLIADDRLRIIAWVLPGAGVDAADIVLAHVRCLTQRWVADRVLAQLAADDTIPPEYDDHEPLSDGELDDLLWWVRRAMEREVSARTTVMAWSAAGETVVLDGCRIHWDGRPVDDREALVDAVASAIGGPLAKGDGTKGTALAWDLCEKAGWAP